MAITKNTKGSVTLSAQTLGNMSNVTLTIDQDVADITPIGKTWKETLALGKGWSATGTVWNSSGDSGLSNLRTEFISGDATSTELRIYEDTTAYFKGACVLTNFTYTKGVGSADVVNFSATGDSGLTYSTA
jgi:hypothetical protein